MNRTYTQSDRPLQLDTPALGTDALLLKALRGREAISELFHFEMETLWQETQKPLAFDRLLGQKVTAKIAHRGSGTRYFNGIVAKIMQGGRDTRFLQYRLEVVPQFWLLQRRRQSRMFQQLSVPEILKKVLEGLDVAYELQGDFFAREYCVQYRESDFHFASRLMEEEGIYYYFLHTADGHQMVVANTTGGHLDVPGPTEVNYEPVIGGAREESRVLAWRKTQEVRSGRYTLRDYC